MGLTVAPADAPLLWRAPVRINKALALQEEQHERECKSEGAKGVSILFV